MATLLRKVKSKVGNDTVNDTIKQKAMSTQSVADE